MGFSVQITKGDKELIKLFKKIGPKIEKKIARKSLRAGAKVVLAAVKASAPVDTGRLKDNIKVRAKKGKRGEIGILVQLPVRAKIGVAADYKWYYPAVIEFRSDPFMRSAYDSKESEAESAIFKTSKEEIRKELRK